MTQTASSKKYAGQKVAFLLNGGGPTDSLTLGGKGAGLVKLTSLGIPVPAAFTISTSVARAYAQHGVTPRRLRHQMQWGIQALEKASGKRFGDPSDPLTVSVRSGASVSMAGMMDTVLNLGLTPTNVAALAEKHGTVFAYDCYRRFLAMFGEVVLGLPKHDFEQVLHQFKDQGKGSFTGGQLQEICRRYKHIITVKHGKVVPTDPVAQLEMAVEAVLASWNNPRAVEYRRHHKISNNLGTAVNVQTMVFGNRDDRSLTGVVFSRNVVTGQAGLWGEFLVRAQGEDLVAGIRDGLPLSRMATLFPAVYSELKGYVEQLEADRGEPVDVEFTVQSGKLYILQVRAAKLSAEAAVTTAVHFTFEKKWTKEKALKSVRPEDVEAVGAMGFEPQALARAVQQSLVARGLPASPGAVVGRVVKSSRAALQAAARGEAVVLVRPDTSPDDLEGMIAACAIVTATGGATSHAAVVARGLGKPAVVSCGSLNLTEGELVSVDGGSGVVVRGEVQLAAVANKKEVNIFLRWLEAATQKQAKGVLKFEYYEQSVSYNDMLNDFYLADAMAEAARGTTLANRAMSLKRQVHQEAAGRLAMYLVVAVGGEMRHAGHRWDETSAEVQELKQRFAIQLGGDRREAQHQTLKLLRLMEHKDQAQFTKLCAVAFQGGYWGGSVGGKPWADIAWAAHRYLTGVYNASVFADHAFDLEHNNGSVFGKNPMLVGDRFDVKHQLNRKKNAASLAELYTNLSLYGQYSRSVDELYRKGVALGIFANAGKMRR